MRSFRATPAPLPASPLATVRFPVRDILDAPDSNQRVSPMGGRSPAGGGLTGMGFSGKGTHVENEPKRMDIIVFMAPVNEHTISHLIDLVFTADAEGSSHIFLHISSAGGKLHPAFTAYNYLRGLKVPLHTHNTGNVEGAALMLYLASDRRSISPNSRFVLTNLDWRFGCDYVRFGELSEAYQSLKHDIKCYGEIFNDRTNKSLDVESCLTGAAKVLDPEEGLKAGIVTDPVVASPAVPELAKLWLIHS